MISSPAIEPAISTLPVNSQLIAKVSSVPKVRQLTALRTDLVCVSAPRNDTTGCASLLDDERTYHAGGFRQTRRILVLEFTIDRALDYGHFACDNPENSLIEMNNRRPLGTARISRLILARQKGAEMKVFVTLVAICALSQAAGAQTGECKSISDSAARLACYDKAAPPAAAAAKPPAPASKTEPAKYVDSIGAEDARMNARLKNICRGC
jgi:hypothetical protein